MKQEDHRKITEGVAKSIAPPTTDLSLLIAASGEHPDLEREGSCSHHSIHNLKQVNSSIRKARREFLRHDFSPKFQRSLGYALHYIQDLLTISVPDLSLHGRSLSLHNEIESKFSKYTAGLASEGFKPRPLEGEDEVLSFVRESIESVSSPQRVLSDPQKALEGCFETCLSVANAVCNNKKGFPKGAKTVKISDNIERLMKQIRERLDEMAETVTQTILRTRNLEAQQKAHQRIRWSLAQESHPKALLKIDLRKLHKMEDWENELSENVSKLNEIIETGYEQDYEIRQANLGWYGLKRTEFKTVQALKESVKRAKEALSQADKKRTELELRIQDEMDRIDRQAIDKLLDRGQFGLEIGHYEQAREYFEQALALDASNREAMKGLARVNEILRRRAAMAIEPTQVEPVAPLQKEPKGSPMEWFKRQSRLGRIAILAGVPLVLCCLCVGLASLISPTPEPTPTPTPTLAPTNTPVPLPTPSGLPTVVFSESVKKQIFRDWADALSTGMGDEDARAEIARGWGIAVDYVKAIVAEGIQKSWMPTATPIPIPPTPTPALGRVGQKVEAGGIALTVNNVSTARSIEEFWKADEGFHFLIVDVTLQTTARESARYNIWYFKLKDSQGFEYTITMVAPKPQLQWGDLGRGEKVRGYVAFEIPENSRGLVLSYEPRVLFGGYEPLKVNLGR